MKIYEGKRTIDGLLVTVDGRRLDEHYQVKRFTNMASSGPTKAAAHNSSRSQS